MCRYRTIFVFFLNSGERSLLKSVERVLEVQGKPNQVVPRRSSRSSSVFVVDARDAVVVCCVCVCEQPHPDAVCVSGAKKKQIKVRRGRKVVQKARKIAKFPRKGPAFSLDSNRNKRFTLSRRNKGKQGWARDVIPREGDPNGPKTLNRTGKAVDRERNKPRGKRIDLV